ncbi:unnamed protein product [Mortierella alpina]
MSVATEELIVQQTFSNLLLFQFLAYFAQGLINVALTTYACRRVGRKYRTLVTILAIFGLIHYRAHLSFRLEPLYAARSDAIKCLELLRLETLDGPNKTGYTSTYQSCTAILRLPLPDMSIANHAASAEREVSNLERSVAAPWFMGISHFSSSGGDSFDDMVERSYASLHCAKSWAGIARWIAESQLADSIGNRTQDMAPSEATPDQNLKIEF